MNFVQPQSTAAAALPGASVNDWTLQPLVGGLLGGLPNRDTPAVVQQPPPPFQYHTSNPFYPASQEHRQQNNQQQQQQQDRQAEILLPSLPGGSLQSPPMMLAMDAVLATAAA